MINIGTMSRFVLFLVILLFLFGCQTQEVLFRFEGEKSSVVLIKKHILTVLLESDAADKKFANVLLSDRGQDIVSIFTKNNLNKKISIISNNVPLIKDVIVRDIMKNRSIRFSFSTDKDAIDFVERMKNEL